MLTTASERGNRRASKQAASERRGPLVSAACHCDPGDCFGRPRCRDYRGRRPPQRGVAGHPRSGRRRRPHARTVFRNLRRRKTFVQNCRTNGRLGDCCKRLALSFAYLKVTTREPMRKVFLRGARRHLVGLGCLLLERAQAVGSLRALAPHLLVRLVQSLQNLAIHPRTHTSFVRTHTNTAQSGRNYSIRRATRSTRLPALWFARASSRAKVHTHANIVQRYQTASVRDASKRLFRIDSAQINRLFLWR